jgi:HSP20 family protein
MNRLIRYTQPGRASLFPVLANRLPWTGLEAEADRLLAAALADFAPPAAATRFPVDLYEDKDNTYVRAALPGVTRDAITIEMVDGYLTIGATRKNGEESFNVTRSVAIPEAVQADKVSAAYENGMLTVTLPKQEQVKPRKINISVN